MSSRQEHVHKSHAVSCQQCLVCQCYQVEVQAQCTLPLGYGNTCQSWLALTCTTGPGSVKKQKRGLTNFSKNTDLKDSVYKQIQVAPTGYLLVYTVLDSNLLE